MTSIFHTQKSVYLKFSVPLNSWGYNW